MVLGMPLGKLTHFAFDAVMGEPFYTTTLYTMDIAN